jgi:hypothetical protein
MKEKMDLIMQYVQDEGLELLTESRIPYKLEAVGEPHVVGLVRFSGDVTDKLRGLGFRVGKEVFEGEKVVFYKGKFFGFISG